jgi:predicted transcriptional regulator
MAREDDRDYPYGGHLPHSGTDTSRAAAERVFASAGERQNAVLSFVKHSQHRGVTVAEVREQIAVHHGTASRALTVLHMTGKIVRLRDQREGAKIYVLPEFVWSRVTERFQGTTAKHQHQALEDIYRQVAAMAQTPSGSDIPTYNMGRSEALSAVLRKIEKAQEDLFDEDR